MLKPATIPLTIYQGVDFREAFRARDGTAGTYTDTAGHTGTFRVYPDGDYRAAPVVELTTENGGVRLGVGGATLAETTMAAAAARGAESITVESATGIGDGDGIDVRLDDGNVYPTRVRGAPIGGVIALGGALPGAASAGNAVRIWDPAGFGLYNILLSMSAAATKWLVPWGYGQYVLDLIDPYGRAQRLAQHICVLQEGD